MKKKNPFMLLDKSTKLLIVSIMLNLLGSTISFVVGLILTLINNGVFPAVCIIISLAGVIGVSGGTFMLCISKLYSKNEEAEKKADSARTS